VHDEASALVASLRGDMDNLERELRSKRAAIKRLQSEQDQQLRASRHFAAAMRVLETWRALCAPAARELGGRRLELVIARLNAQHSEQELTEAVVGYARLPFIVDRRRSPHGTKAQWFADADLVFRDAKHVEAGIRMAGQDVVEGIPEALLAVIPWRRVRAANRRAIIAMLRKRFGGGLEDNGYLNWPCPRCDNHPTCSLRIAPVDIGTMECFACGLGETQLIQMLDAGPRSLPLKPSLKSPPPALHPQLRFA